MAEKADLTRNYIGDIERAEKKITFDSAGKTVPAYLYLPKGFRRPLQLIQYAPAGDVVRGYRTLPHSIEVWLAPVIRAGRAIFSVELEGFLGRPRPPDWVAPDPAQDEYVDYNVAGVTEIRRGIDYLESRPDIDHSRIALYGLSAGGGPGVFVTALDRRYRSVMFAGTGIGRGETKYAPAKGFVVASDLQAKLKKDKSLKDKKAAVAAFDKLARGKWVLFTGPLVNTTDDGFDIGLEYTPQLPNDPMGMSRQFFEVTMTQIDGYTKDAFKGGNLGVVLAKYVGAGKATPGYELVSAGVWH